MARAGGNRRGRVASSTSCLRPDLPAAIRGRAVADTTAGTPPDTGTDPMNGAVLIRTGRTRRRSTRTLSRVPIEDDATSSSGNGLHGDKIDVIDDVDDDMPDATVDPRLLRERLLHLHELAG